MMARWVLVTGTSRGIGRATALRLARGGMSVIASVRMPEDGLSIEEQSGGRVRSIVLDIGCDDSIGEAAFRVSELVGSHGLYGLVNNAAVPGHGSPIEFVTRKTLEEVFRVNAFGTTLLCGAMMPLLRRARGGIVNVGAGKLPLPPMGPGFSAKSAMESMMDHLRIEVRGLGVGVSIVYPGMTRWEDVDEQLAIYGQEIDAAVNIVAAVDKKRFENVAEHVKAVHRRFMSTAASADSVAITVERALTARWPRARYYCGWEQKAVAALERLTTERLRDAIVRRMTGL